MENLSVDLSRLSPKKRELFALLLKERQEQLPSADNIAPRPSLGPSPLSYAQERLWFIDQLQPGSAGYNVPVAARVTGPLDVGILARVIDEIVRRHEVLRTRYEATGGGPVQVIEEHARVMVPVVDLSGLAGAEAEAEAKQWSARERLRPFDLERGPVVRVSVMRLRVQEHVILYTLHHIASDGWSMGVLNREISLLYQALSCGEESPLEELPVQYADYAVWQRGWLRGQELEGQMKYWKEQLAGISALELPTDRPRAVAQSFGGVAQEIRLGAETSRRLKELSQREGVTLFMTLLAGLQVVLSRYSGQEDIAVGAPIANRNRAEIEGLIGFFVNTLVLRTDMSGDPTVSELLGRVKEVTLGAYGHQDLPFEKLVGELQPERDLSRNPLFQVLFALQNTPDEGVELAGLKLQGMGGGETATRFDVEVHFQEQGQGLNGRWICNRELFDRQTMEQMVRHLERVLEGMVREPGMKIGQLELLSEQERRQMVREWNRTEADYGRWKSVPEMFEEQARRTPGAVAVEYGSQQVSYDELDRRSNQLGRHLRAKGVGPEELVGLCVGRGVEMVVGMLGILKAGGAYVPLDPGYPAERLRYMIEDAGVEVVVTEQRWVEGLGLKEGSEVRLDEDWEQIGRQAGERLESGVVAEHVLYMIYTSGSTGRPKGIKLSHGALRNLICWHQGELLAGEATLQFASLSFDASFHEIFAALVSGGRLVVAGEEERNEVGRLVSMMKEKRVRKAILPVVVFQQMALEYEGKWQWLEELREITTTGEQLQVTPAIERLSRRLERCRLHNHYGPSETHVVTAYSFRGAARSEQMVPIGKPIANTQVYILDREQRAVPMGVAGEIYIGGANLGRNYHGRADLTAERFVPHVYSEGGGQRLYRTGDLGRYRRDGEVEFMGRKDQQVKIRGYRVELGEIENELRQDERVEEAVVVVREVSAGNKQLVGYVVRAEGTGEGVLSQELKRRLREKLPEYMVPAVVMELEKLPLTRNGKVDRGGLPAPEGSWGKEHVGPRTELEEQLAGIWKEVLRVERVGVTDNFFELGGHSLLATQVVSRIREALKVELPLRALFEHASIGALSLKVRLQQEQTETPITPRSRGNGSQKQPLSFQQERLWFTNQLQPGNPAYHLPAAVRVEGLLRKPVLESVVNEIIRRHEALRTTFDDTPDGLVQVIHEHSWIELPLVDLQGLGEPDRLVEAKNLIREDGARPFDLINGPLVRVRLLRIKPNDHIVMYTVHHIVFDGWSVGVLNREIETLYQAFSAARPSPLAELPVQYADYAVWQRAALQAKMMARQMKYWKARLSRLTSLELPTDRLRPSAQTFGGAAHKIQFKPQVAQGLREWSRREGATLFIPLLAGLQALLSRYSGQDDIAIASPIANRNRAEIEGLIGFFVNALVLRTDLGGDPTAGELLRRVKEGTLEAYEHQDLPFGKLVEELHPERDLSRNPLAQVSLTLHNAPDTGVSLNELKFRAMDQADMTTRFDLELHIGEMGQDMFGWLVYNRELFTAATAARMAGHLERIWESFVTEPDRRLSGIELLTAAEQELMAFEWNNTAVAYPDRCIHELFEVEVAKNPTATAVVDGSGRSLNYGELNLRANRLARHLVGFGVGPEVLVGLCVERSIEMVVGLLAILKAGGAYVALDPDYSAERLGFMMEDGGILVVLAQQKFEGNLPPHNCIPVILEGDGWMAETDSDNLPSSVEPRNLAYVIYTSGSTGRPKGTTITHRGVVRLVKGANFIELTPEDAFLNVSPLSFDGSTLEIWGPLLNGGKLALLPAGTPTIDGIVEAVQENGVTTLWLTASLFRVIVDERLVGLKPLRQFLAGGDVLSAEHVCKAFSQLPGCRVINGYGPTENTTATCCHLVTEADFDNISIPIGRPVSNTRTFIVDRHFQMCPVGIPGELCAAGDGLARGYLNSQELTAVRFVPNPFSSTGERLYRTGDLCSYLADGRIRFIGRIDRQVKIRGYRVEVEEIEALIRTHPEVRDCVVIALEDEPGEKRLVAYVVTETKGAVAKEQLREYAVAKLPGYLVPAAFVFLDQLPLTPNGKTDRQALPRPEADLNQARAHVILPRTPLEEILCGMWTQLFKIEVVGTNENFFELGGHSLLATQAVSRIRETLRFDVPVKTLFEFPTIVALAQQLETEQRNEDTGEIPKLTSAGRRENLPLAHAQERLWIIDQLLPDNAGYISPAAVRLKGSLRLGVLERVINEVVRRHEVLRTTFEDGEKGPVQVIHEAWWQALPVLDLSGLEEPERQKTARELIAEEGRRGFDLRVGPVVRVGVLRLGEQEHVILYTLHHIASDGWSMGVLNREIGLLYEAFGRGEPSPLEELPVQYADYAVWQRGWLEGEVLERQMKYWKEQLAGLNALELPTERVRPIIQTFSAMTQEIRFSAETNQRLKALGQREGVTLFMTLLTGLQVVLSRYSGQEDIAVGAPIANRNRAEIEGLIGFFVNTLVLRTDLSGDPTVSELLGRVRQVTLGAYGHQDLPFEKLVEELQPERDLSRSPLVQVSLALQNAPDEGIALNGMMLDHVGRAETTTRFDLELHFWTYGERLRGLLIYNCNLFNQAGIERMGMHLERVLEGMGALGGGVRISGLKLMEPSEEAEMVEGWNRTEMEYEREKCAHELFEEQVRTRGEAVAVECGQEAVSFGELNERAQRVAWRLRQLGVGPEVLVGVCLERSVEMVAGLLGVWKAGGAYVPLDPANPMERLAYIMEDAGITVLVTSRALEKLPMNGSIVVYVEEAVGGEGLEEAELWGWSSGVGAWNLAYVMYTSGSTGRPKGVMVAHRGLVNYLSWSVRAYGMEGGGGGQGLGSAVHSSIGFDLTVTSLYTPLVGGRRVRMIREQEGVGGVEEVMKGKGYGLLKVTPGHLEVMRGLGKELGGLAGAMVIGGEALKGTAIREWQRQAEGTRLINEYGPTETVVGCCVYEVKGSQEIVGAVPIGRPIGNTRIYVMGRQYEVQAVGMAGEIWIGGDGVARGYWNRSELTAEKFVPDPYGKCGGERMYRSGDVGRYMADGTLEYMGRQDQQVKVRGYRIELGEIENVLSGHAEVRQSVVVVREDGNGERKLVGYVVGRGAQEGESQREQVGEWKEVFNEHLYDGAGGGGTRNFAGWNSSYTGQPIEAEEMNEWLEGTVSAIRALKPGRILEIGSGSGLVLFEVAPWCTEYWGTDFSGRSLEYVRRQLSRQGLGNGRVKLLEREADNFEGMEGEGFDGVVINSVAQYFPDMEYLVRVLDGAVGVVKEGGFIYVGDVRSKELWGVFHGTVEVARAGEGVSVRQLRQRIEAGQRQEKELLVEAGFFEAYGAQQERIKGVRIRPKRGKYRNELSMFRYEVMLTVGGRPEGLGPQGVKKWAGGQRAEEAVREMAERGWESFVIEEVGNGRLDQALELERLIWEGSEERRVGEIRRQAQEVKEEGIDPEEWYEVGERMGYEVELSWARGGRQGRYDVEMWKGQRPARQRGEVELRPWREYGTEPLRGRARRRLAGELKRHAAERLPRYMVPAVIVVLEEMPLTGNGKVDRRKLPEPVMDRVASGRVVEARTEVERRLERIWSEVLGVGRVSMEDNFFELGGHSLLATQVASRIRESFQVELPLRLLFENPTIVLAAEAVEKAFLEKLERISEEEAKELA